MSVNNEQVMIVNAFVKLKYSKQRAMKINTDITT